MDAAHLPTPPRGHTSLIVAVVTVVVGLALLVYALAGGSEDEPLPTQPTVPAAALGATTPAPSQVETKAVRKAKSKSSSRNAENKPAVTSQRSAFETPPPKGWVESFYPIYAEAQRVFGVNWLLIASVHRQETAFSTHPTTYRGLNFAGCCGGPMQFNVTNGDKKGRGSTWDRYRLSYELGNRPKRYLSERKKHPSLYDDFDAIMAAGALLRDNGASSALDASAWRAAYDYYGHDLTGISYASQVTARAIGWAKNGFCAACVDSAQRTAQVDAAWGAPIRGELVAAEEQAAAQKRAEAKAKAKAKARKSQSTSE